MLGMRNTTYVDPKKNDHIYFDHVVDERPEIAMVIEDGVGVEYKGQVGEEEVFENYLSCQSLGYWVLRLILTYINWAQVKCPKNVQ